MPFFILLFKIEYEDLKREKTLVNKKLIVSNFTATAVFFCDYIFNLLCYLLVPRKPEKQREKDKTSR